MKRDMLIKEKHMCASGIQVFGYWQHTGSEKKKCKFLPLPEIDILG